MCDLQCVEYMFFVVVIVVCVLISVYYCLFGDVVDVIVVVVIIFGQVDDFFVVGLCGYFMFDLRYVFFFGVLVEGLCEWEYCVDGVQIGIMNCCCVVQMVFVFCGFFGQDVVFEGLIVFDGIVWMYYEVFCSVFFGFYFRYDE